MSKKLKLGLVCAVTVSALSATASAQMTRNTIEHLAVMPAAHSFNVVRPLSVGTPIYFNTFQNYAIGNTSVGGADDPLNAVYAVFGSDSQSSVYVTAGFADPVPPPGVNSNGSTTDGCHHSHLAWAVYQYGVRRIGATSIPTVKLYSSTGEIGRRMINGQEVNDGTPNAACVVTSDPDSIYSGLESFTWGATNQRVSMVPQGWGIVFTPQFVIVAAQAANHGWGNCGRFLCYPGVQVFAMRFGL